jgi:hypothetical protein
LRASDFVKSSRRLVIAALLIASAASRSQGPIAQEPTIQEPTTQEPAAQEPTVDEMPGADAVQGGCRSVVLVQCAQSEQAARVDASGDERRATRRKLESRRLRQKQAEAGLNAIEITAERPLDVPPDPWETFRRSLSNAAEPDCLSPDTFPGAQGLLRLPVLLGGAASGKCR